MDPEVFIPLTQGKVAVIDFADFDKIRHISWSAYKPGAIWYAVGNIWDGVRWRTVRMHRLIMSARKNQLVDHINRDGLDNRRSSNLRFATKSQNNQNQTYASKTTCSSLFIGVHWHTPLKKWRTQINANGVKKHLGVFETEEAAAKTYDAAAKQYFGEFARLNFP